MKIGPPKNQNRGKNPKVCLDLTKMMNALCNRLWGEDGQEGNDCSDMISLPRKSNNSSSRPPLIKPGVTNHILVYSGSFNPPHQGHLGTLQLGKSSFFNCTAAIIRPSDDCDIRDKMFWKDGGLSMAFPYHLRASMWEEQLSKTTTDSSSNSSDGNNDPWCYVWKAENHSCSTLLAAVEAVTKAAGFDVRIYDLIGSDCYRPWEGDYYHGSGAIFTDWSRFTEQNYDLDGKLLRRFNHSSWKKISYLGLQDVSLRREYVTEDISKDKDDSNLPTVWIACDNSEPENVSFYVSRPTDMPRNKHFDLSSTTVRKLIRSSCRREVTEYVLGASVFMKYLEDSFKTEDVLAVNGAAKVVVPAAVAVPIPA